MARGPLSAQLGKAADRWGRAVQNALEISRIGRIGPEFSSPYAVMLRSDVFTLRRYAAAPGKPKVKQPLQNHPHFQRKSITNR